MSYTGVLDMQVGVEEAYKMLRYMMLDLDATIASENAAQHTLLAKSAPSMWTYGFNFNCSIEAVTETTSRLTVNTTLRKWSLIDTQSKRYTKRLLTVMEAYAANSNKGEDNRTDALANAEVQRAFNSVHGHRQAFYIIVPIVLGLIAVMKIAILSR